MLGGKKATLIDVQQNVVDQTVKSRSSSLCKVGDSESGGPWFEPHKKPENSACAFGQGTIPKVDQDNDHLLSLDYKNGMLKYLMAYT